MISKQVNYAYPSSTIANQYHMPDGCWTVAVGEGSFSPWPKVISHRVAEEGDRFDLFVIGFLDLIQVARVSVQLEGDGLRPELITLAGVGESVR